MRSSGQTRALGLGFWDVASQEFKKGQEQIPHFRHALLKLALSATGAITPATARKMFARDCEKKVLTECCPSFGNLWRRLVWTSCRM